MWSAADFRWESLNDALDVVNICRGCIPGGCHGEQGMGNPDLKGIGYRKAIKKGVDDA
jgi:hypothetical protein